MQKLAFLSSALHFSARKMLLIAVASAMVTSCLGFSYTSAFASTPPISQDASQATSTETTALETATQISSDTSQAPSSNDQPSTPTTHIPPASEIAPSIAPQAPADDTVDSSPSNYARPIPEGRYVIRTALAYNMVIGIENNSAANGATAKLVTSTMSKFQQFDLTYEAENAVLTCVGSDLALDLPGGNTANGTQLQQWEPNGTDAQKWIIKANADDTLTLCAASNPSQILDVAGASTAQGTKMQTWSANGSNAQRFIFIPVNPEVSGDATVADGVYTIKSAINQNIAIDIDNGSLNENVTAQLWSLNGRFNQDFILQTFSDNTYAILALPSGLALTVQNGNVVPTTPIIQKAFSTTDKNQRWCISQNADGSYTIVSASTGLALDAAGGIAADGTAIHAFTPNGTKAQEWILSKTVDTGIHDGMQTIVPACSPSSALDIPGASTEDGVNLQLWSSNRSQAQIFDVKAVNTSGNARAGATANEDMYTFQSVLTGYYITEQDGNCILKVAPESGPADTQTWIARLGVGGIVLINCASGKALDVAGASTADGANIGTWPANSTRAQGFAFINASPVIEGRTYRIASKLGNLSFQATSESNGANVVVNTSNDGDGLQKWIANNHTNGTATFINPKARQVLDLTDISSEIGANIQIWTSNSTQAQNFSIIPTGDGWFYISDTYGHYLECNGAYDGANVQVASPANIDAQKFRFIETSAYAAISGDIELDTIINRILDENIGRDSDALYRAFRYVADYPYISGSKYPTGEWSIPFAKEMYYNHGGNCYRFASLFCWLARGLGYDARAVQGSVPSRSQGWAPHGWVEIYMNGSTYVCDPDLYKSMPYYNWFMVTYANTPVRYRFS